MSFRVSVSHFWNCLTLSQDCPFKSARDPHLQYFGLGLLVIYLSILFMIFFDLHFFWSLEKFLHQVHRCISGVKKRLGQIHSDQRKIQHTQMRAERQLQRSKEAKNIIAAIKDAVAENDTRRLNILSRLVETVHSDNQDFDNGTGDHDFY